MVIFEDFDVQCLTRRAPESDSTGLIGFSPGALCWKDDKPRQRNVHLQTYPHEHLEYLEPNVDEGGEYVWRM